MRKAILLFCLLPSLILPVKLIPDTLRLPADSPVATMLGGRPLCQVDEGSRFQWERGELRPLEGLFSFHTADRQPLEAMPASSAGTQPSA